MAPEASFNGLLRSGAPTPEPRHSMASSLRFALVLPLVVACTGSAEPASVSVDTTDSGTQAPARPKERDEARSEEKAVLLEEREITDPARGDMVAYRLLVPEGWELEGGVTKVGRAYSMIPTISDVTVRAPDGRGARFYSLLEYGWADGVPARPGTAWDGRPLFPIPETLGEHWRRMFELFPAKGVSDLEVVSEKRELKATRKLRELLKPLFEAARQEDLQLRPMGQSHTFKAEARRLVIRYRQDGEPIEATIFACLQEAIYRNPDGSIRAAMWNLDHTYAVFGPPGSDYLNDPVLAAVVRSRRETPEWREALQRWYLAKNQQIVQQGQAALAAAARSAATSRASQSSDVLDISFQGWKSRNAAGDTSQAKLVSAIHERTTYAQPGGGTVDLPSYYQNVYTDGQGHYVLHDDANWEINADHDWNGREWTRMEARR